MLTGNRERGPGIWNLVDVHSGERSHEITEMNYKTIPLVGILSAGLFVLTAQQPDSSGVFTSAQAEAGRLAYERTCGKCHTPTLLGRKGDPGELPPLSFLSASYQKFIGPRGFVAPLAGKVFIDRWGGKTAGQLLARFQETVDDPYFQFEGMKDETTANITAYVLQVREGRNPAVDQNDRCHRQFDNALNRWRGCRRAKSTAPNLRQTSI